MSDVTGGSQDSSRHQRTDEQKASPVLSSKGGHHFSQNYYTPCCGKVGPPRGEETGSPWSVWRQTDRKMPY